MSGDYTRFTFNRRNHYSGVRQQQGRVQLDSDWNEAIDIIKHRQRVQALDTFGPVGVPFLTNDKAFKVSVISGPSGPDIAIEPGRLYVDGILVEAFKDETPSYLHQPFLPDPMSAKGLPPPSKPPKFPTGSYLVYLDVWEREVTYVEQPLLLDVALGGADTATRTQTVWQLRLHHVETADCGAKVGEPASAGLLSTDAIKPPPPDDPCLLPPLSGYRGIENRLYRVEVHKGGPLGTALFKWSRDNGSIVSPVTDIAVSGGKTTLTVKLIGRDQFLRIAKGNWVTVTDDHRELHGEAGEMAFVEDIDEANNLIILDRAIPSGTSRAFGATPGEIAERHTRVQRWDQNKDTNTLDADGLMTTGAGPLDIEDGITVNFATVSSGDFRIGDYWAFWARTATAEVEKLDKAPPRGIRHHYVQLAAINGFGATDTPKVEDCRPKPQACECACCLITVGKSESRRTDYETLAEVVEALPDIVKDESAYVIICLETGVHEIDKAVKVTRSRTTIRGCGLGTQVIAKDGAIVLAGSEQALEHLHVKNAGDAPAIAATGSSIRIVHCRIESKGSGPLLSATKANKLEISGCEIKGAGGLVLGGRRIDLSDNVIVGGGILLGDRTVQVRISDNHIAESAGDGIALSDKGLLMQIEIERNLIENCSGAGITSGGEHEAAVDVHSLVIRDNTIRGCDGSQYKWSAGHAPAGGIALRSVFDTRIEGNDIFDNGLNADAPVCGVWIGESEGLVIHRNRIEGNRPAKGGERRSVVQGGIHVGYAQCELQSVAYEHVTRQPGADNPAPGAGGGLIGHADTAINKAPIAIGIMPAAEISENLIDAPIGHAIYIVGDGAMTIRDNRLRSYGAMFREFDTKGADIFEKFARYFASVFVLNAGLSTMWSLFTQSAGFLATTTKLNAEAGPGLIVSGGQVRFTGNQVRVDLRAPGSDFVPFNIGIMTLDDSLIAHNQTEGLVALSATQVDWMFADVVALAATSRQADNGLFTPPVVTLVSLLSSAVFNHCLGNQASSCIFSFGPNIANQNNIVIAPSQLCLPTFKP